MRKTQHLVFGFFRQFQETGYAINPETVHNALFFFYLAGIHF